MHNYYMGEAVNQRQQRADAEKDTIKGENSTVHNHIYGLGCNDGCTLYEAK